MPKYHRKLSSRLFVCFIGALLVLLSACSNPFTGASSSSQSNLVVGGETPMVRHPTASATSQPVVQTQTTCPAPGTARAAVMPTLQLGTHQQIVYYHNIDNQMVLDIFDVQRQAVAPIIGQTGERIQTAQVSADGQWVLMVVNANGTSELQLVRIDGQFFQTLYCAPAGQQIDPNNGTGTQWSPDQKRIIFNQGSGSSSLSLYILQLASGSVRMELSPGSAGLSLVPTTWLDNTRVYIYVISGQSFSLYLLDTSKGTGQHVSDMQLIRGVGDAGWDFDTSADGKTLYMSIFLGAQGTSESQAEIDADSINGALGKQILLSHTLCITNLRVINSSSLMFVSFTQSGTQAQDNDFGWWKINTDGTGLIQLNRYPHEGGAGPGSWGPFNPYTQYLWSNFSRDGSFYTDGLFYGSLNGGPLTRYANDGEGDGDVLVGWTTM